MFADKQEVKFVEGELVQISCFVNGSHPPASVRMLLNNEDISSQFRVLTLLKQVDNQPLGLRSLSYDIIFINSSFIISYEHHNKILRCEAAMDNKIERQIGIRLNVTQCKHASWHKLQINIRIIIKK